MATTYPPGASKARVTDQGYTKSKNGNPMFFLQFQVLEQVGADGTARACPQLERTYFKALTEKTIGWLCSDLKAIGVELDKPWQLDPQAEGAINLIGREITAYCAHADYQGEKREQWDIRPSGCLKLGADDIRKLDDVFGPCCPRSTRPRRRSAATSPTRRSKDVPHRHRHDGGAGRFSAERLLDPNAKR
jgi:hypothetical protein